MRNKKLIAGITVFTVCTTGLTGFGRMVDSPVVEEKTTSEEAENTGEPAKAGSEAVSVPEQVNAPEAYQGVPVEVPDVEAITIKRAEQAVLEEECDGYLEYMEQLADEKTLEMDEPNYDYPGAYYISGKMEISRNPYLFYLYPEYMKETYGAKKEQEPTGMGGLNMVFYFGKMRIEADGSVIDMRTNTPPVFPNLKDMDKARENAEKIIDGFGINGFSLCGEKQKGIVMQDTDEEKKAIKLADAAQFVYERMIDGVPLTWVEDSLYPFYEASDSAEASSGWDACRWDSERLSVQCTDEMLWGFIYANPMKISGYSDESQFLLPFGEIQHIYENTITEKYKVSDEIKLSKVKLGYMRIREEKEKKEGLLIPVWDFFGSTKEITEEFYSLLTIDARDGTIIERRYGY